MKLRMWMLDVAREQSPTLGDLRRYLDLTRDSGYNAIGLYLEHRFAYPSAPWAHGKGCLGPEDIKILQSEYPEIQIIPFINLLGHFEGMLYTEYGKRFREETFKGLQACPCNPEFIELCHRLIDDTLSIFNSPIIHLGGDETQQLGACPLCKAKVEQATGDGKAALYRDHFAPLAQKVIDAGRQPGLWGDMFLQHPTALEGIPKSTLMFDWQYFENPVKTSAKFIEAGFQAVLSPAIHTYNASWCHLGHSERNVRDHIAAAQKLDAYGVCLTTWELGLMGNYETILPAIRASGRLMEELPIQPEPESAITPSDVDFRFAPTLRPRPLSFLTAYAEESAEYGEWARLMSEELQNVGGMFAFSGIRSSLKARLLLFSNPFLAWLYLHEELTGVVGDQALQVLAKASQIAPNASARGATEFARLAIEFVRYADQARQAYAQGLPGVAVSSLAPCRQIFESLEKIARATNLNIGGSMADVERCRAARDHVERVMLRIKEYGDGSLGYLPAFEIITHPKFMPHDQACWWLINRWANE